MTTKLTAHYCRAAVLVATGVVTTKPSVKDKKDINRTWLKTIDCGPHGRGGPTPLTMGFFLFNSVTFLAYCTCIFACMYYFASFPIFLLSCCVFNLSPSCL